MSDIGIMKKSLEFWILKAGTYPDPTECPSSVAEAIFDIRRGANIIPSWRVLQRRYDTDHGVLVAVEVVYEQNEWIFERGWRSKWRKGFAAKWA